MGFQKKFRQKEEKFQKVQKVGKIKDL